MPWPVNLGDMLPADSLAGQTIAITGGGTGLGRSMGRCFLQLGARLLICGRREQVLQAAAQELSAETGGEVHFLPCDVRQPDQIEAWLDAGMARFGQIHTLVNNAAGNFICPSERLSTKAVDSVVDIVLKGTAYTTLALGKRWIAAGQPGTVLNIVAAYAWTGSGFVLPSAMAKAGVLALTRSLASEWGRYQIRVNAISPGPFPTPGAWSRLFPPEVESLLASEQNIPAGRTGEHAELANLAAYLVSSYSQYITGECITMDGGQSVHAAGMFNKLASLTSKDWDEIQAKLKPRKKEAT